MSKGKLTKDNLEGKGVQIPSFKTSPMQLYTVSCVDLKNEKAKPVFMQMYAINVFGGAASFTASPAQAVKFNVKEAAERFSEFLNATNQNKAASKFEVHTITMNMPVSPNIPVTKNVKPFPIQKEEEKK